MAYNSYFPQFYQPQMPYMNTAPNAMPQQAPQMPQNGVQTQSNGITWVQGEAAAKSYPVAPGQSVLLMDSEESIMYIKSTDTSGMPLPLRIFDYKERSTAKSTADVAHASSDEYVSREEFNEFKEDVKRSIKGIRNSEIEDAEG